jgi:peptide/nickel transport system substrate-binding protein
MKTFATVTGAALLAISTSAFAQKSADTMRFPITEAQRGIGAYFSAQREGNFIRHDVYEALIEYDPATKKFVPVLATSYKQVNPSTWDFELREDIKFHNGNAFDADDVVATINFMADEKNPEMKDIFNPRRFHFVDKAEKLSPTKVRVTVKKPEPPDLLRFALLFAMYDAETLATYPQKVLYESNPVGTGAYRVLEINANTGVTLGKFEGFKEIPGRRPARASRVRAVFMPDRQSQIANLLAGNIDLIRDANNDQVKDLTETGRFVATPTDEYQMLYLEMAAGGRTGFKPITDERVRKALVMAIDRNVLKALIPGGQFAEIMDSMCYRSMLGCDVDVTPPPKYDPDGAKKLLAEAGYANGFDIELTAVPVTRDAAVAVSGMWRRIGVNATIDHIPLTTLRKKWADDKVVTNVMYRPYSALPDVSYMMDNFFYGAERDMWRDAEIDTWGEEGLATFDLAQREKAYKKVLDRINERAYMLPIATMPSVFIHTKDVVVHPKRLKLVPAVGDLGWK